MRKPTSEMLHVRRHDALKIISTLPCYQCFAGTSSPAQLCEAGPVGLVCESTELVPLQFLDGEPVPP